MAAKIVCDFCNKEYTQRGRDDDPTIPVTYKEHEVSVGMYINSLPGAKYQSYDACPDCHKEIIALATKG